MIRLVHCPEEHVRVGVVRPVAGVLYVHGCRRVVRQDPVRNVLERAAIKGVGPSLLGTNTVNSVVWKCCTVFRTETAVLEAEATSAKSSGSLGPACLWFRATIDVQAGERAVAAAVMNTTLEHSRVAGRHRDLIL